MFATNSVQNPVLSCLLSENIKTGDREWVPEEVEASQVFKIGFFMLCPLLTTFFFWGGGDKIKEDEVGGMWHVWGGRGEVHTEIWWRNLKERPFGRSRRRGENYIKIDLKGTGWNGRKA